MLTLVLKESLDGEVETFFEAESCCINLTGNLPPLLRACAVIPGGRFLMMIVFLLPDDTVVTGRAPCVTSLPFELMAGAADVNMVSGMEEMSSAVGSEAEGCKRKTEWLKRPKFSPYLCIL